MQRILTTVLLGGLGLLLPSSVNASVPEPDVTINEEGTHVVINLPQTRLFLYNNGQLTKTWPVAVGKMLTKTPIGDFEISGIYHDPVWYVPRSIQREMKSQGKKVYTMVPPGPHNPLGKVFVRFGAPELGLGMHGTNVPASVPGFRTHGCIRMRNADVIELSSLVGVGTTVTVAYQPIMLNVDRNNELWLTAYRDGYRRNTAAPPQLTQALSEWQRTHRHPIVNERVAKALKRRHGVPVCLTCQGAAKKVRRELLAYRWLSYATAAASSPPFVGEVEESAAVNKSVPNESAPFFESPPVWQSDSIIPE